MSLFRFIAAEKANHSISLMCKLLGVSRSGFHAWERRPPSDRALADAWFVERIAAIHRESRGTYGSPRVYQALRQRGHCVGKHRVARLMRRHGIKARVATIRYTSPGMQRYFDSVLNERLTEELIRGCDCVYHLASAVGVKLIMEQPVYTIDNIYQGTEVVLRLARRYRNRVLITSTSEVYGKSDAVGAYPSEDPVSPGDIGATIYTLLGIRPETTIVDKTGQPHPLSHWDGFRRSCR